MSEETPSNGNLINFIAATVKTMRDRTEQMHDRMGQMRDQMATKSDIARPEVKVEAVRGDIERTDLRLDSIERTIRVRLDQMDAEISRLRSVIYLLAKDRPEVLRLLGEHPTSGSEAHPQGS